MATPEPPPMIRRIQINLSLRRLLPLLLLWLAVGCEAPTRQILISAVPPDSAIFIDGTERGRGRFQGPLVFGGSRTYTVRVSRLGFTDQSFVIDGTPERDVTYVTLKPRLKQVRIQVNPPLPSVLRIDGKAVSAEPRLDWTQTLEFTVDKDNRWTTHVATIERAGFQPAEATLRFEDSTTSYTLTLEPVKKDIRVTTDPPGAVISIDGERVGVSPFQRDDFVLGIDPLTNEWRRYRVRAEKPGYDPAEGVLSWDTPSELVLRLAPTAVTIRPSVPEPIDRYPATGPTSPLTKPAATRPTFPATGPATVPAPSTAPTTKPATLPATAPVAIAPTTRPATTIPAIAIRPPVPPPPVTRPTTVSVAPITRPATRPVDPAIAPPVTATVALLRPRWTWKQLGGWTVESDTRDVLAPRSTDEPDGRSTVRIARAAEGETIDQLVTAPDGKVLLYAVLSAAPDGLHSRLVFQSSDLPRAGEPEQPATTLTNGRADLMPSFAPGGLKAIYVTERTEIERPGIRQVTVAKGGVPQAAFAGAAAGRSIDLWPCLDSSPKPRLFVESRTVGDARGPRVVSIDPESGKRTDLGEVGVQPRVSPRADALIFVRADSRTGKRDLFLLRDFSGENPGKAINLTNSPDEDDFDPAWSKDGSRIAWASDRPVRVPSIGAAGIGDANIWIMDLSAPEAAIPLTASIATDDNPAWSGDDEAVYYRSNRGGEWGVWKVAVPGK